jgi:ABC-type bacteriocin/lantibiotic exporter with double-glycine peptidase domain
MKKFFERLTLIMLALIAVILFSLSILFIWNLIDLELTKRITDTLWVLGIVALISFILNCAIEE